MKLILAAVLSIAAAPAVAFAASQADLARIAMDERNDVAIRVAAVNHLKDQALLEQVALSPSKIWTVDYYQNGHPSPPRYTDDVKCGPGYWQCIVGQLREQDESVKRAAIARLTDQPLLMKIAMTADDNEVGYAVPYEAVNKLTDQAALANVALKAKSSYARNSAVRRVTDQAVLARVALNAKEEYPIRDGAIENLIDQAVLAQIAIDPLNNFNVRNEAEKKLTDETAIEKFALEDVPPQGTEGGYFRADDGPCGWWSRRDAIQKVANQEVLLRIAQDTEAEASFRTVAVASLEDSASLKLLAEDETLEINSPIRSIARLKLAITEPRMVARLGKIRASVTVEMITQPYVDNNKLTQSTMAGEIIEVSLVGPTETLVQQSWRTEFPQGVSSLEHRHLIEANLSIETTLARLFQLPAFTQEDLVELSASAMPEVRNAALASRKKPWIRSF
ncbi:MAG: hypothetical protein ABSC48_08845 [Terracidiphilus sp.]|jgi:hypothetical protein